uniref:BZIP domain-containing protein n=1 Tax=Brassica campestris TaxID=3711 RepID=M4CGC0_BRACM
MALLCFNSLAPLPSLSSSSSPRLQLSSLASSVFILKPNIIESKNRVSLSGYNLSNSHGRAAIVKAVASGVDGAEPEEPPKTVVSVDKLPLESKEAKEKQLLEQRMKMKLAKKIRLHRKRLVRKRKLRKKGRWPPSKMKKLKNRVIVEDPKSQFLNRQQGSSLYTLTLDEVQTHLGSSGKSLGSMNLDELLNEGLSRQGSLALPRDLSKKTVDEVWKDIQQDNKNGGSAHERRDKQGALGEMTLEDLLLKAGVVAETIPGSNHDDPGGAAGLAPWVQYHQLPSMTQPRSFFPYLVADMQVMVSQASLMGGLSDTQTPGRKRVASGEVVEKIVERKQKRMIKNRESAARSRARKQAYTHELEIKVSRLEEENERLRRQKEVEKILPSSPPPDPKRQLRRTSSAPF